MSAENDKNTSESKRLPIWALSPREEKRARENLKKSTYKACDEVVKAMAECAKKHGVKVFPACDEPRNRMKECILSYQVDQKYLDHERDLIVLEKINKLETQLKEQQAAKQ